MDGRPWATEHALALADSHYACCMLCEHRCGVDRNRGQRGPCKAGVEVRSFRHRIEVGEEIELIPSHLFYLSGCDLRCVFCIAEENAFNPRAGEPLTQENFDSAVRWGIDQGARNIQWVGGEPTIHTPAILRLMARTPVLPPVIWKSDFHGTPGAFALLAGAVDTFVADFKFGNDACAERLGGVPNYFAIVSRNLKLAKDRANLIVRHLLLPGHFDCCYRPIVDWMQTHLPTTKFSIRDGYLPKWRAKRIEGLSQPLEAGIGAAALELAVAAALHVIQ